ncbi:hypothetical protein IGI65_000044 [Enterococcus sp. DIV0755b]|uniref:hypothetical protein n=1 Tax=Enterococcus sp. DIV0755b TaxID=2774657 RepID=UPI003F1EEC0F
MSKEKLEPGTFIRRNLLIHKGVNSDMDVSEKAVQLAQEIANLINHFEVNYYEINQAIILVDNGFYEKALKNERNGSALEQDFLD